jgi:hypothetical protein
MKYRLVAKFLEENLVCNQWTHTDCIYYMGEKLNDVNMACLHSWLNGDELPKEIQIDRIAQAFAVSHDDIQRLIDNDLKRIKQIRSHIREFDPNYYLQIRLIPAVHQRTKLPDNLTENQAIQYASEEIKKIALSGFLDTPRGVIHWFSNTGVLYASRDMKAPKAIFNF